LARTRNERQSRPGRFDRGRPEGEGTEKERFFSLVNQLTQAEDAVEKRRLKEELARMTYGG
jgi:hypothetical protein